MGAPTTQEVYNGLIAAKERIDDAINRIETASPEVLRPAEEVIHVAFDAAFVGLDVPALLSSLEAAGKAIKDGRGPTAGGAGADLA